MENDIRTENNENLVDINDYFQLDFEREEFKGNRKFEEFKKKKLNELGKDAKLFHCKNDNVLFYVCKKICKTLPLYYKQCPSCNNYICYFCGRVTNQPIRESHNCCPKLRLYYLFFYVGFENIDSNLEFFFGLGDFKKNDCCCLQFIALF